MQLHEVAQMITYKDAPYVRLEVSVIELTIQIPDDVEQYGLEHFIIYGT